MATFTGTNTGTDASDIFYATSSATADYFTGGGGADTFIFKQNDTPLGFGGSAMAGTISGYDVITDYWAGKTGATSENIQFTSGALKAAVATKGTTGVASKLFVHTNLPILSHAISSTGLITFSTSKNYTASSVVSLTTLGDLAAAAQYLQGTDIGDAGSSVIFNVTLIGIPHTFVWIQAAATATAGSVLIDLQNVQGDSLSFDANGLHVLDTIATAAPTITLNAETAGGLTALEAADGTTVAVKLPTTGSLAKAGDTIFVQWGSANNLVSYVIKAADITAGTATVAVSKATIDAAQGAISVMAWITDLAGNKSANSATASVTVDTFAPNAPVITSIPEALDGYLNATEAADGTTVVVSLSNTSALAGDLLKIVWGNQTISYTLTSTNISTQSATVTITAAVITAAGQGTKSVSAYITDAVGNISATSAAINLIVDTAAPNKPTIISIPESSGGINAQEAVDGTPVDVSISGTNAAVGDTISIQWGAQTVSRLITSNDISGGIARVTVPQGVIAAAQGVVSVTAYVVDAAGNKSAISTAAPVNVDTLAPNAPSITMDSETIGGLNELEASNGTPIVVSLVGTNAAANDALTISWGGQLINYSLTSANITANTVTIVIPQATIVTAGQGNISVTAYITDAAGNISPNAAIKNVFVDTLTPIAPIISSIAGADNGVNLAEAMNGVPVVVDLTLTTAVAGDVLSVRWGGKTVNYTLQNGDISAKSATVSIDAATIGAVEGSVAVTAFITDGVGNISPNSATYTVQVDTVSTLKPTISGIPEATLDPYINKAEALDGTDVAVAVSGIGAKAGDILTIQWGGQAVSRALTSDDIFYGSATVNVPKAMIEAVQGDISVTAYITDLAGNRSASSLAKTVSVDTNAPGKASINLSAETLNGLNAKEVGDPSSPNPNNPYVDGTVVDVTLPSSPTTAAAVVGDVITLKWGSDPANKVIHTVDQADINAGVAHITVSSDIITRAGQGTISVSALIKDAAGNESPLSDVKTLTVDTIAPGPPTILSIPEAVGGLTQRESLDGTTVNIGLPGGAIGAKSNDVITLNWGGQSISYTIQSGDIQNGAASILVSKETIISAGSGDIAVSAFITDAAGNESAAAASWLVAVDLTLRNAPQITEIPDAAGDGMITSSEASDGVEVKVTLADTGAVAGDKLTIQWGDQSLDYVIQEADLGVSPVVVNLENAILRRAGQGDIFVTAFITQQVVGGNVSASDTKKVHIDLGLPTAPLSVSVSDALDEVIDAVEASNGAAVVVNLSNSNAIAGDILRIHWGNQTYDQLLNDDQISTNKATVIVPSSIIEAEAGNLPVRYEVSVKAGIVRNQEEGEKSPHVTFSVDLSDALGTEGTLRSFTINQNDLGFILNQVNFKPLFDSTGNAIIKWNGRSTVYDQTGKKIWDSFTKTGSYNGVTLDVTNYQQVLGSSYADVTDASGVRNVDGTYNNLIPGQQTWGATDSKFIRMVQADFGNYLAPVQSGDGYLGNYTVTNGYENANYAVGNKVYDYTPRMISRLVTTGGETPLLDNNNHIVFWSADKYNNDTAYRAMIDKSGVDIGLLVEGAAVITNYGMMETLGHTDFQNPNNSEKFIQGVNPGVAPNNMFFAYFGQFFDHGTDFIGKGSTSGKIKIALSPNDPLWSPTNTSITISRAIISGPDANGDPTYINKDSPYIDQSQTYGSKAQITQILREWVLDPGTGHYVAGIRLLDGNTLKTAWAAPDGSLTNATLPTLNELRKHLLKTGRDDISWEDISNLRNRDASGHVITGVGAGLSGQALLLDMNPDFTVHTVSSGLNGIELSKIQAIDSSVVDIVADAVGLLKIQYADNTSKTLFELINPADFSINSVGTGPGQITAAQYKVANEILLESIGGHYMAGDGRVDENVALTTIHHVFHMEHNYQVDNLISALHKQDAALVQNGDTTHTILRGYQKAVAAKIGDNVASGVTVDSKGNYIYNGSYVTAAGQESWDQDKVFLAAKLINEMEYQHVAVDQYARSVTPDLAEFVGYNSGSNASTLLEYAEGAFRFGHSTMLETISTMDPNGGVTGKVMSYALEKAFLNTTLYSEIGPSSIALGLTHQGMAEVDEILTPAMNQGLLGQPLDLGAINIARGRDLGIPTLNEFRQGLGFNAYNSWQDFGNNIQHAESLVNFIAAYSFDGDIQAASEIIALADGSLVSGEGLNGWSDIQAIDFLTNNSSGGSPIAGSDGFNHIDTWLGGLAEQHVLGGILGETFNAVFVAQLSSWMDNDRFYYLYRLVNQQFGDEIGNEQFKDIVERNTGLTHLNGNVFDYADQYYDVAADADNSTNALEDDFAHHKYALQIDEKKVGVWSSGGKSEKANGDAISFIAIEYASEGHQNIKVTGHSIEWSQGEAKSETYVRDIRVEQDPSITRDDGMPISGANSDEVYVGTKYDDYIHGGAGDDTVYGEDGNDIIYGDAGVDRLYGGKGNDIIHGGDGPELMDGGEGDDILFGESSASAMAGVDQLVGGAGNDVLYGGVGIDKLYGGGGDDVIFGEQDTDAFTHGGDGNDYIDGGTSGDLLWGDSGDDYILGADDQDAIYGGKGDDILLPGDPSSAMIAKGNDEVSGGDGSNEDTGFDLVSFTDFLQISGKLAVDISLQANPQGVVPVATQPILFQLEGAIGSAFDDTLSGDSAGDNTADVSKGNNWLIGGADNDVFEGRGGNDLIVGGSIRLDALIGAYDGGGQHNSYGRYDEVTQSSHRAVDGDGKPAAGESSQLSAGLLGNTALGTEMFDKHFTEMMKSYMFKDLVLGDGLVDGTGDTAVFSGRFEDYKTSAISFVSAHGETIQAIKIEGVANAGLDDGTDLVVGVESFRFANRTLNATQVLDQLPVITASNESPLTFNENVAVNTTVLSIAATDPDLNTTLTYSIVAGNVRVGNSPLLSVNSRTGVVTFAQSPDYEAISGAGGVTTAPDSLSLTFDFTVAVTDGIATVRKTFTTMINNVNEAATGSLQLNAVDNGESATLTAASTLVDQDVGPGPLVYTLQWQSSTNGGSNWSDITIGVVNNVLTLTNFSRVTQYRAIANYTDVFGAQSVQSSVAIIGTNGNDAISALSPTISAILGKNGDDTITDFNGVAVIDGGDGTDTITLTSNAKTLAPTSDAALTNIETIDASGVNSGSTVNLSNQTEGFTVIGGSGKDVLLGGFGADTINGGDQADTINGGGGADTLTGGNGGDTFVFKTGSLTQTSGTTNQDAIRPTITDFSSASSDKIDLSQFDANPSLANNQALFAVNPLGYDTAYTYNLGSAPSGEFDPNLATTGLVNYHVESTTNTTANLSVVDINTINSASNSYAEYQINLSNVTTLSASSLTLG